VTKDIIKTTLQLEKQKYPQKAQVEPSIGSSNSDCIF